MKVKRMLWGAYLVPLALAVDRVTKVWARKADLPREVLPGVLGFTYVKNTGAAFSAFSGKTAWVTAVSVILVLLVLADCGRRAGKSLRPAGAGVRGGFY